MLPTTSSSTVTLARVTGWTTARTRPGKSVRGLAGAVMPWTIFSQDKAVLRFAARSAGRAAVQEQVLRRSVGT